MNTLKKIKFPNQIFSIPLFTHSEPLELISAFLCLCVCYYQKFKCVMPKLFFLIIVDISQSTVTIYGAIPSAFRHPIFLRLPTFTTFTQYKNIKYERKTKKTLPSHKHLVISSTSLQSITYNSKPLFKCLFVGLN